MNLTDNVRLSNLFEVYGKCLTEKQQQIYNLYVLNDLSLAEVSSILGISRQAVKYAFDNASNTLIDLESKLGFADKVDKLKLSLEKLKSTTDIAKISKLIDKIVKEM